MLALGAALAVLPGCFRPMLAEGSGAAELRGRIALPAPGDRFEYFMHEKLEERLGRTSSAAYRLEVAVALSESGLLVAQDNTITRLRMQAIADFRLFRDGTAEPVLADRIVSESGYDSTASLYSSRTTRRDIERRLARDLGERIARRIQAQANRLEATAQG